MALKLRPSLTFNEKGDGPARSIGRQSVGDLLRRPASARGLA